MDLHLQDKVALVTGGSRGLGRAIAVTLAAEGARVAINYRRERQLAEELARTLNSGEDGRAVALPGDVSCSQDVTELFNRTEAQLGPLDVLVNNAGIWPSAYVTDITEEQWDRTLAINLKGPFLTCREAVRRWLAQDRAGRIVNVSTPAAFRGATTGHAHYAASKAGLVNLTITLAREVASQGIHVNAIAPGMMRTDMAQDALKSREEDYLKRIPLGRIADPEEIADAVAFLASDRANYTTGATFDASGGMLMR